MPTPVNATTANNVLGFDHAHSGRDHPITLGPHRDDDAGGEDQHDHAQQVEVEVRPSSCLSHEWASIFTPTTASTIASETFR